MATKRKSKGTSIIAKIGKEASKMYKAAKKKGSSRKYTSFVKEAAKALKK
ncbi:hypothetical protein VB776_16325 [Arcicella sp. DC2W]|uniref:Uncharacterized protein n=1 Tax=Arcicella gelida TaxID=2984195 RepID=A0ABU5S7N5_9BACT|nr:hypothetical protein [Arcicella sp. DC2W]MEA5404500.1 hypothetical protein [Arcicella sp. DC2W]